MFVVAKMLKLFFFPPGIFALLLFLGGLTLLRRAHKKKGAGLILLAFVLYLAATPLVGRWALESLERGQRVTLYPQGDVIVLLTSGLQGGSNTSRLKDLPSEHGLERIVAAADMQKALGLPVIISGGPTLYGKRSLSLAYGELMMRLGVARQYLVYENRSLNTWENARYTKQLCDARGYRHPIVITSGFHLRRALYCFQKAGLPANGFPSGFSRRPETGLTFHDFVPEGYSRLQQALNEYVGIAGYRVFNWFD